jgi:hypothetical protein
MKHENNPQSRDLEDIQTTTAKLKSETGENLLARTWLERRWEWMTATWGFSMGQGQRIGDASRPLMECLLRGL